MKARYCAVIPKAHPFGEEQISLGYKSYKVENPIQTLFVLFSEDGRIPLEQIQNPLRKVAPPPSGFPE